jgi:hypothetical protein
LEALGCPLLTQSGHRQRKIAAVQLGLTTPFRWSQIPDVILFSVIGILAFSLLGRADEVIESVRHLPAHE